MLKEAFNEALELDIKLFNRMHPAQGKSCLHVAYENNLDTEVSLMIRKGAGILQNFIVHSRNC